MPAETTREEERPAVRVAPSIATELSWIIYVLAHKNARYPLVQRLAPHGLVDRLARLWPADIRDDGTELLLLAEEAGRLFDLDPEPLFDALECVLARGVAVRGLGTETEEDAASITRRMELLHESPATRAEYIALLRDLWAALRDDWEREGRDETLRRVEALEAEFARHNLRDVIPRSHLAFRERFAPTLRGALNDGTLVVVPLYFGGEGCVFTELGEHTILGFGQDADARMQRRRARSEKAAATFKVLSDPTRLSLLSALLWDPSNISCLAERFELAQPTVSVHMKALREAGLVEFEKIGGSTLYSTTDERIRQVVEDALALVTEK